MPVKKKIIAAPRKLKDDDTTETGGRDEFEDFGNMRSVVKPDDQLQLSEQELKEEFTRVLTANNPHAPQNIVRYSFKERQYKPIPQVEQLAIHFNLEGNLLHKDSDDASRQTARNQGLPMFVEEKEKEIDEEKTATEDADTVTEDTSGEKEGGDTTESTKPSAAPTPAGNEKKLTNQFNFCERATQTYNNPLRERGNATEPPPRTSFNANISQWIIYDDYIEDFEKSQEKNKDKKPSSFGRKENEGKKKKKKLTVIENQSEDLTRIERSMKIIERMVNQNTYDEIAQDFCYYEDESDIFKDSQGSVLPLWRFTYEKARKLSVTTLCWSPCYHDMFVVGYGSYEFTKQEMGMICFYTLKNPSFPEYIFETESGVMTLNLHPDYPHMLCVGFYDGSVGVYNTLQSTRNVPLYVSTAKTGKHTEPVWQVRWQKDDLDNNMNFFSVSADGRITLWTIVKTDLNHYDVLSLQLIEGNLDGPDGTRIKALGSGTTFDFHSEADHLFLVGTEEGRIHKCSKAYNSQFLDTIEAHHMAVYKVIWNKFHSDIFMTCSADWTVKIWDINKKAPLFVFDLGSPVGDIAWAPYSSTVFAAVCADGKVHLYDLNVNKYESICEQAVAQKKKARLTHISFNRLFPILIIGDDRGCVQSMKLSPNLRKMPKEKKGAPAPDAAQKKEAEIAKLNKIIQLVG